MSRFFRPFVAFLLFDLDSHGLRRFGAFYNSLDAQHREDQGFSSIQALALKLWT